MGRGQEAGNGGLGTGRKAVLELLRVAVVADDMRIVSNRDSVGYTLCVSLEVQHIF